MLTETEAKAKWCFLTIGTDQPYRVCVASGCMSWRWAPLMADDAYAEAVRKAATDIGDTSPSRAKAAKHVNANRAEYGLPTEPFQGFCGLAGKPERLL